MSRTPARGWTAVLAVGPLLLGAALGPGRVPPNGYGPPLGHTGGFGEPTCRRCHMDNALNPPGGTLTLLGVPDTYAPGVRYRITVTLEREGLARAGFQLAARYVDGVAAGESAGNLTGIDDRVEVVASTVSGVQYAQHTEAGSLTARSGSAAWTVEWTAAAAGAGDVRFDVAANAANDDESELGDFIYTSHAAAAGSSR